MNKAQRFLYSEFVDGRTTFDWLFLATGLGLQIIVYLIHPAGTLSLISGISGIISVILCSQRKITTFLFGFIQISTYLYLSLRQHLYAEVGMNIFYFLSQFYGIYAWRQRYAPAEGSHNTTAATASRSLVPKRLSLSRFALISLSLIVMSTAVGFALQSLTNDTQPYLDAFTTIPAIAAQILMVMALREQWYIWLFIDALSVVMWLRAGDYSLAAQYIFWCANCIYGLRKWQ